MPQGADVEPTSPESGAPQPTGRERFLRDLRRPKLSQLLIAVLLAMLGFGAVTQVRTNGSDKSYATYRTQDLIDVLNGLSATTQRAQSQLGRLEQQRDALQSNRQRQQADLNATTSDIEALDILAGRAPAVGPGIRVTISEDASQVNIGSFIDLVQSLRSAGAEAIQVNGKARLIAQSYFDLGPRGLVVDGVAIGPPPYVVEAIGTPKTLAGAVTFLRGPADLFHDDGATVNIHKSGLLRVDAVRNGDAAPAGSAHQ